MNIPDEVLDEADRIWIADKSGNPVVAIAKAIMKERVKAASK